jgi:hypothetical protein
MIDLQAGLAMVAVEHYERCASRALTLLSDEQVHAVTV